MRYVMMFAVLLILPSCGAMDAMRKMADKATISLDKAEEVLDNATATTAKIKGIVVAADKDGDGQVSGFSELWALLTGIATLLGIGGTVAAQGAKKKLTEHKRDIYSKVDDVRKEMVG